MMNWRSILIFFFFSFFISNQGFSQYYEAQILKIADEKGESPSATFAITEDSKGFIWFGTVDGLYRFDGYNFKIFRNQKGNPNSLSNNTIRALYMGSNDNLFIGTQGGGLNVFNIPTETFERFEKTGSTKNEISGNSVWSVIQDRNNNIWVGVSGFGVDKYNQTTKEFKHFQIIQQSNEILYETLVRSLFEDSEGNIWIGTGNNGVYSINTKTEKITQYFHNPNKNNSISNNSVHDIFEDKNKNIWLCTYGGGLNIFQKETQSFLHITHNINDPNSLTSNLTYHITNQKKSGKYLIATEYGLCIYDHEKVEFSNYKYSECNKNSISDNRIRTTFIDKNENIWVGTESGVDQIIEQNRFKLFRNKIDDENSIPQGIVRSIWLDSQNELWVGLIDNGLYNYNYKTGKSKFFKHDQNQNEGLTGNHITAIFEDSKGDLWFAEWDTGLLKYDKKSKKFTLFANAFNTPIKLTDNRIQVIREPIPGYLFVGTEGGINIINLKNNTIQHLVHEPNNPNSLNSNAIQSNAFVFDSTGNLWVGIWSYGLNRIEFTGKDFTKPKYTSWVNSSINENSLSNDNVISLCFTNNTILWIGTFGGGLNRFDLNSKTFKRYSPDNGLPNSIIYAILEDNYGNIWLSTDKGISKFNPKFETFENFYQDDGLQADHFFWGSSFKSKSGELFFGGISGLNSFFPDSINRIENNSKPAITDIKIVNENIDEKSSVAYLNSLNLKYNQNKISIEFTGLNFADPQKTLYQYYLTGVDNGFNFQTTKRTADYTNLKPGKYFFHLKVNKNGEPKLSDELIFNFNINPPWWQTLPARFLFITICIGVLFGIYYLRIGVLESQKVKLMQQVKERTTEITEKNDILELKTNEIIHQKEELENKNIQLHETLFKLEATQKALIESEKMASLGIMSSGLAHEINNPLNFISMSIENIKMLIAEIKSEKDCLNESSLNSFESLIKHTETGIERINKIVKSLRIFSHKDEIPVQAANINELIDDALTILKPKMPNYITLKLELNELPVILCKPNQILQVLNNIIDNAIAAIVDKKVKSNEEIYINSHEVNIQGTPFVEISIVNTGPIIAHEMLKHLFDPFFTTKSPNKGSGLGLYIAYNLIHEHKGQLIAYNLDNQVVFKILLPKTT